MKTTLDLSDALLLRAKALAKTERTTLRNLTEEGLSRVLAERESRGSVKLKPVTFKGNGLTPEFEQAAWSEIRDAAYGMERG
ncbi:MAG: DUF2191 domain-containing protein [Verrucomicrobia bacterium]|nr:DUF2191 domain-containing protein [Verrucomicrobiota bacterium]MCH8526187.1 DUF2191 domain-containing protein [Kiritimatiellia bacterium]